MTLRQKIDKAISRCKDLLRKRVRIGLVLKEVLKILSLKEQAQDPDVEFWRKRVELYKAEKKVREKLQRRANGVEDKPEDAS